MSQYRSLKPKAMKSILIDKILYWKELGGMLLKCLERSNDDSVTV